jgi:hypothetical protein
MRQEARAKGAIARQDMVRRFSPEVLGEALVGHLQRIEGVLASAKRNEGGGSGGRGVEEEL